MVHADTVIACLPRAGELLTASWLLSHWDAEAELRAKIGARNRHGKRRMVGIRFPQITAPSTAFETPPPRLSEATVGVSHDEKRAPLHAEP